MMLLVGLVLGVVGTLGLLRLVERCVIDRKPDAYGRHNHPLRGRR